jgi:hypothetical protein
MQREGAIRGKLLLVITAVGSGDSDARADPANGTHDVRGTRADEHANLPGRCRPCVPKT